MCDLIAVDDVRLTYGLEGVDSLCVALADLHDLTKTAFANDSNELEVINAQRVALQLYLKFKRNQLKGVEDERC